MNRCPKCKNELVDDARFCNICGAPQQPSSSQQLREPTRTIQPVVRHIPVPITQKAGQPVSAEFSGFTTGSNGAAPDTTRPGEQPLLASDNKQATQHEASDTSEPTGTAQPATAPLPPPTELVSPVPGI